MIRLLLAALFVATGGSAVPTAQAPTQPAPNNALFEKMKMLVGVWEATYKNAPITNTFRVFGEDSAILHIESSPGDQDIVSVIYPVGAELRVDHYCYLRNQPRFVAKPQKDPNVIEFELRSITNLAFPGSAHMHATVWRFIDANHLTQEWHRMQDGKDTVVRLEFVRK